MTETFDDLSKLEAVLTRAEQAERTIELLESNARVQAKLLADTGRRVEEMEKALDAKEEALHRIESWSRTYPLRVFPEPDMKRVQDLLEAGGITLDAVSASCMRHCVKGVGKIARAALSSGEAGK